MSCPGTASQGDMADDCVSDWAYATGCGDERSHEVECVVVDALTTVRHGKVSRKLLTLTLHS